MLIFPNFWRQGVYLQLFDRKMQVIPFLRCCNRGAYRDELLLLIQPQHFPPCEADCQKDRLTKETDNKSRSPPDARCRHSRGANRMGPRAWVYCVRAAYRLLANASMSATRRRDITQMTDTCETPHTARRFARCRRKNKYCGYKIGRVKQLRRMIIQLVPCIVLPMLSPIRLFAFKPTANF